MSRISPKRGRPCKFDLQAIADHYHLLMTNSASVPTDKEVAKLLAISPRHFRRLKKKMKDINLLKIGEEDKNKAVSERPEDINTAAPIPEDIIPNTTEEEDPNENGPVWRWQ